MSDLIKIIEYYINNNGPKEINCNYKYTVSLQNVAEMINNLDNHKVNIDIKNKTQGKSYTGEFQDLGIKFIGLEQGIKETYNRLK